MGAEIRAEIRAQENFFRHAMAHIAAAKTFESQEDAACEAEYWFRRACNQNASEAIQNAIYFAGHGCYPDGWLTPEEGDGGHRAI